MNGSGVLKINICQKEMQMTGNFHNGWMNQASEENRCDDLIDLVRLSCLPYLADEIVPKIWETLFLESIVNIHICCSLKLGEKSQVCCMKYRKHAHINSWYLSHYSQSCGDPHRRLRILCGKRCDRALILISAEVSRQVYKSYWLLVFFFSDVFFRTRGCFPKDFCRYQFRRWKWISANLFGLSTRWAILPIRSVSAKTLTVIFQL